MTSILVFFFAYCALLTVPGLALAKFKSVAPSGATPLTYLAISYLVFTLIFITSNHFALQQSTFYWIASALVTLAISMILANRRAWIGSAWLKHVVAIFCVSFVYQLIFSSFSEVPADVYTHLERIQAALKSLENNHLGIAQPWHLTLQQKAGVYYYLVALIAEPTGISPRDLFEVLDFANRSLFLIAVFFFTLKLFAGTPNNTAIAYAATVFVTLHMGINVFAFVRYYSLAPTMLALVLYFYAVSLFVDLVKHRAPSFHTLLTFTLIVLITVAAASIHTQEAIFIGVMIAGISLVGMLSRIGWLSLAGTRQVWLCALVCIAAGIGFVALYKYSLNNLPRAPNAHWRLWDFGEGFWVFPQLTVLNLKFQFARVVTLWGLLIYVLFFIHIKRYRNNYFIIAGMLSPLVTFLNPFFVDVFLRHYNSTTVWRLCYLLPIHFVAADLFVYYFRTALTAVSHTKKALSASLVCILTILLLPAFNTWGGVHYSRFPTLISADKALSYKNYKDLLDFLDSLESSESILTDPLTGYLVSALTHHHSARRKFFRDYRYQRFSYQSYHDNPLDRYSGSLLIVNRRPDSTSEVGRLSNHWRVNEWLETHHYYPDSLIEHLESRAETFSLIWANRKISVYRIL